MDDAELQKRLDRVSELLGQKITLVEPPPETKAEPENEASTVDPLQWQRDMTSAPEEEESSQQAPEQEDRDSPKRFFDHDLGPRANIQDAFDNSRFVVGEPIEASAEFCPWKVVMAYPSAFVGKTNRPHVRLKSGLALRAALTKVG